jgi:two-component system response regulator PilR (NtrC family)
MTSHGSWIETGIAWHGIESPAAGDNDRDAAVRSDASVLIILEPRDERRDCARSIHLEGLRRTGPFVAFDCGVSDIVRARHHPPAGRDDLADDIRHRYCAATAGTLFLDRIEMMNGGIQAILMSLLDESVRHRNRTGPARRSDPRLIAGASGSLRTAVSGGRFNAALFYRLNVIQLDLRHI